MNWFDLETRSTKNVVDNGLYAHAEHEDTHILGGWWRLGDDYWSEYRGYFADGVTPELSDMPDFDGKVMDAIENGELFYGHNVAYDRVIWNAHARKYNLPLLSIDQCVCTAAWAASFNLPRGLGPLSKLLLPHDRGKLVGLAGHVKYMWDASKALTSAADMDTQMEYCKRDVEAMIECMDHLPAIDPDWLEQFHANEVVNDRGVWIDKKLAQMIADMEPLVQGQLAGDMHAVTGEEIKTRGPSLLRYLERTLPEDMQGALVIAEKYRDLETMGFRQKKRKSAGKVARKQLLEALDQREEDVPGLRRLLDAFEEANRAAVGKYKAAITRMSDGGLLQGQFMFSGAGQTGRYSSHGVQVHNLKRDVADNVPAAVDVFMKSGGDPQVVAREMGMPINEAASLLLRPMFVSDTDGMLVWSDWSAIEARVLPWLSADPRAEETLDVFRKGGDIYIREAAGIYGVPEDQIDKAQRRVGKVAVLSLGYQGGVGAFQAMAAGYGVEMDDDQANDIKVAWREANPWAPAFWADLEAAAMTAIARPGEMVPAGRVTYQFLPRLVNGTLICWLPSGRWLAYPQARVRDVEKFDGEVFEPAIVFMHPNYGPSTTYGGALAENVTQAEAASLLREALVTCRKWKLDVVLHVHDEIVIEAPFELLKDSGRDLRRIMETAPAWAEGLPLDAEAEYGPRYKVVAGRI